MTVNQAYGCWTSQQESQQQRPQAPFTTMDISINMQTYDPRAMNANVLPRNHLPTQYISTQSYNVPFPPALLSHSQLQPQHTPFQFCAYTEPHSNAVVSAYPNNYIQRRPLPANNFIQCELAPGQSLSYARSQPHGYIEELPNQRLPVKAESEWSVSEASPALTNTSLSVPTSSPRTVVSDAAEFEASTGVDQLMKAIQARAKGSGSQSNSPVLSSIPLRPASHDQAHSKAGNKFSAHYKAAKAGVSMAFSKVMKSGSRRYICDTIVDGEECNRGFGQKTHLSIHQRRHTGEKPYQCELCPKRFSQRGNLKTHTRRHTEERPFKCSQCDKRFAQSTNVKSHENTHSQNQPFRCRVSNEGGEECNKRFTQLGNLKCHMNRFHLDILQKLTAKFLSDTITDAKELDLWNYFANLYKNSNKGIKGRGKNNKVNTIKNQSLSGPHVTYPVRHTMGHGHGHHGLERDVYGNGVGGLGGRHAMPVVYEGGSQSSEGSVGTMEYEDDVAYVEDQMRQQQQQQQLQSQQQQQHHQGYPGGGRMY